MAVTRPIGCQLLPSIARILLTEALGLLDAAAPVEGDGDLVVAALPCYRQFMSWHPRFDADPASRWLRAVVRRAAREVVGAD